MRRFAATAVRSPQRFPITNTSRLVAYEAAGVTPLAQPCIIEIKDRRDVHENLQRISHELRRPKKVMMSALDEQILALP